MTCRPLCPVAVAILATALTGPDLPAQPKGGPLSPADALAALQVADGFQVTLFAAEPMLVNPTSIDVDHRGRVWVAEAVNYRRKNFGRPILRQEGDRIVVLVDETGQGKASKAVTFYQGPDLIAPLSVCVIPQPDGKALRVLVAQSPDILEFWDRDGDLKADGPPTKFLTGFGGFDHDHGVHGLTIGPDGKLYFTVGDSGVGQGRDREGKPIPPLQSRNGQGRQWVSNSTDCRAGTVWRCDLDGNNLELLAHNFRNNYEACVDSFGEIWLSDNDDDGNQQTRICFVLPGGNYGYHPRGPGQSHWHEEQPGIVHKVLRTGFGSPTGICFYEGTLFGPKYEGVLLHCDAGPREVRAFFRKRKGAGYELDKEILLTSKDNWFRPSDVCVAPDGSIFVADWYDRGVGGHGMGDPFDGRIYRLTPKGHKGYTVPEVKLDTPEGVLAAFDSPNIAMRTLGTFHVVEWLKERDWRELRPGRATFACQGRLIHAAAQTQLGRVKLVRTFMKFSDEEVLTVSEMEAILRTVANQLALRELGGIEFGEKSVRVLPEYKAGIRREYLLLAQYLNAEQCKPLFYALAEAYDGQDHFYRAALNIACGTDPARRDAILADFDKHFPEWNDRVADLVWELRPKSMLPRLGKLLEDPKLTVAQKARVVDILAANDDPAAGRTMLQVLKSDAAPEMKARALESLRLFLPTKWKALQNSSELAAAVEALLARPGSTVTGLQLIAAANARNTVERVAELLRDSSLTRETRQEAVRTLGKLPTVRAVEALGETVASAKEPALQTEAIRALGSMAGGPPKDEVTARALRELQALVGKPAAALELRLAALEALAGSRSGTIWLLDTHQKAGLPKDVVAEAGRLLRNSPFQGERNRALLLFPAPGKLNPKNLPPIAELAKRPGDAARGKQVWNASLTGAAQCAKCHMVRGVGGQVGPDLSMIGKKASRENLYESILMPSKAIADQYIQHQVTTTSEVTITGLLVADTPEAITLRDANGKDTTIARKEIEGEVRKLTISIMPEDVVAALTEDELADLVAYLETLKTAAFTPDTFRVAGPFQAASMDAALDTEFGPEKGPFDPSAKFGPVTWKTIRPDGKGYFDLAGLHGDAANNSASYLYTEIESPAGLAGEVLLGPDDGARLWVNGKEVFVTRETKAAIPAQHTIPVTLVKGKNTVLLKVANGNNPHGFYFSLTTAEELKPVGPK
jgi:putative membrane-bound dehydrogenase-like protein